jgi:hypothetical protein
MTLRGEWNAISARVHGLVDASKIYVATLSPRSDDPYGGADKILLPESRRIYRSIDEFSRRYRSVIPQEAVLAIDRFLGEGKDCFKDGWNAGWQGIKRVVPDLASISSEVDYHLEDFGFSARRLTERAFVHLRRSIVADSEVREKWKLAFASGELECEKLGSVHLLLHGIWAFKAYSSGERTDLVLGERIVDTAEIESVAEALVLTEWKKIKSDARHEVVAEGARKQVSRYSEGSLAGIELASHRYIVLVSKRNLAPVGDVVENGVVYRHINIPVDPLTPSKG